MSQFKTTLDLDSALYKVLNIPAVTSVITGKVYSTNRPDDSVLEDVVINTITLGDGTIQLGVTNVNIYALDLEQKLGSKSFYQANKGRLSAISKVIIPLLEEAYGDDYNMWIEWTTVIPEPEIQQHYLNIRVQFRFENVY